MDKPLTEGEIEFAAMLETARQGRYLPPLTTAEIAVRYILNRRQTDPDLGYLIGSMTESFDLLCRAEAETTGKPLNEVASARRRDLQPEYRKRAAEVVTLRKELEALRG